MIWGCYDLGNLHMSSENPPLAPAQVHSHLQGVDPGALRLGVPQVEGGGALEAVADWTHLLLVEQGVTHAHQVAKTA